VVRIGIAPRSLIAALAATLALAIPGLAQSLQRLTPTVFTFTADTSRPELQVPFHLIVTLHVKEPVGSIDRVTLPILSDLQLGGDERALQSSANGTDYRETITVIATHTGEIDLAPVTLAAIDGRDGKAKQFYTNALKLTVVGGALEPLQQGGSFLQGVWDAAGAVFGWVLGIGCAIAVVVLFLRRRPRREPATAPAIAPLPVQPVRAAGPRSRRDQLQDALSVLRVERSRAGAVRVRAAVWRSLGAAEGETLADVLARPDLDPRIAGVLRALERAAFTYDQDVPQAVDAACDALEKYLA
jgi:hypothetical protein